MSLPAKLLQTSKRCAGLCHRTLEWKRSGSFSLILPSFGSKISVQIRKKLEKYLGLESFQWMVKEQAPMKGLYYFNIRPDY